MVTLLARAPQIKTEQGNLSGARTAFVVAAEHQDTAWSMAFPHWELMSLRWEVTEAVTSVQDPRVPGAARQEAARVQDQQLLCSTGIS